MTSKDGARDEGKESMWSSLLDSVASGKQLPEKLLLVTGGSAEVQKDFLATLDERHTRKGHEQNSRRPPVSNELSLGYAYQDVLDADHEDTLARLSIYTLQEPDLAFAPLIRPLLTEKSIPESLTVILLDWAEPWNWLRQTRDWICFLYAVVDSLKGEAADAIEANIKNKSGRLNGTTAPKDSAEGGDGAGEDASNGAPGEWEDAFGLPLCFVCHNSNKIDSLERDYSWREEEFDYLLQFLRTVLLNYGASLIYTSSTSPNSLPLLVQSSLGIYSPLRRQTLKHNVVDRDRILIPPQWDSWGKIKVIREGFDVEGISKGFSSAVQDSRSRVERMTANETVEMDPTTGSRKPPNVHDEDEWKEVLSAYEETIRNPKYQAPDTQETQGDKKVEVSSLSMQEFLAKQAEFLEKLRAEEEKNQEANASTNGNRNDVADDADKDSRINQHIGPVQFNMGGIQVDAEDMLRTLRHPDREETPVRETGTPTATATPEGKQNEQLASFFAGLIKKGGRDGSPKPTPK